MYLLEGMTAHKRNHPLKALLPPDQRLQRVLAQDYLFGVQQDPFVKQPGTLSDSVHLVDRACFQLRSNTFAIGSGNAPVRIEEGKHDTTPEETHARAASAILSVEVPHGYRHPARAPNAVIATPGYGRSTPVESRTGGGSRRCRRSVRTAVPAYDEREHDGSGR